MIRLLATVAVACSLLLAGCEASGPSHPVQSRDERVRNHFAGMGAAIAAKESLSSTPMVGYLLVDEDRLDDGTVRSLWATTAAGYRSRCFYLDEETPDGAANGYGGCGGGETQQVTLGGNPDALVGDVGSWPATRVRITAGGQEAAVPVKGRYFLVPAKLLKGAGATFSLVLLDDASNVITEVKDVRP